MSNKFLGPIKQVHKHYENEKRRAEKLVEKRLRRKSETKKLRRNQHAKGAKR